MGDIHKKLLSEFGANVIEVADAETALAVHGLGRENVLYIVNGSIRNRQTGLYC